MPDFEPKIVAFLCNWCAYAGADLAGVSRMQYPPNLRTVRVMCTGRIDPIFIIRAFKEGCDGVLVGGWHIGDCHYLEGNIQAEKKIRLIQHLLDLTGIGKDRLHLAWVSSAEAQRFAETASNVINSIKKQGELDQKRVSRELDAAEMTLGDETLRWLVGKEAKITKKGDVYGRKWDESTYSSVMDHTLSKEYHKNLIYLAIKQGAKSVRDIRNMIGLDLLRISKLLTDLEKTNRVEFVEMQDSKPVFAAF